MWHGMQASSVVGAQQAVGMLWMQQITGRRATGTVMAHADQPPPRHCAQSTGRGASDPSHRPHTCTCTSHSPASPITLASVPRCSASASSATAAAYTSSGLDAAGVLRAVRGAMHGAHSTRSVPEGGQASQARHEAQRGQPDETCTGAAPTTARIPGLPAHPTHLGDRGTAWAGWSTPLLREGLLGMREAASGAPPCPWPWPWPTTSRSPPCFGSGGRRRPACVRCVHTQRPQGS